MFRHIVHTLLCIAAVVLGFSISREALLIVVSFRLPYGSLFVQTTTHTNGQVAIISFPRMKQTRAFLGSDFSVSRLTNDRTETRMPVAKELSLSTLGGKARVQAFSESKIILPEDLPSIHSTNLETPPRSSRVHVGRHEILIRPWPHPDPLQTASAQHLMTLVQEEQQHVHDLQGRKPLLVVTPTCSETFQLARLTSLMHTLRLIRGSLTWIVVEAGNVSDETAALLANSKLSCHHLCVQDIDGNIEAQLTTEALRYIHDQRLEGIVVFVDERIIYHVDFFDKAQKVKWVGAFASSYTSNIQGDNVAACEDAQSLVAFMSTSANASEGFAPFHDSCNSSTMGVCWYSPMKSQSRAGDLSSNGNVSWSAFVFNARFLWEDHKLSWIISAREFFAGNQSFAQSPVDLVKNSSQIESLESCGHLAL